MLGTAPIQALWKLICSQIDKIVGCDLSLESREFPRGEIGARTYVSGHLQRRDWMDESDISCLMITESETFFIFQWVEVILHGEIWADPVIVKGHPRALASLNKSLSHFSTPTSDSKLCTDTLKDNV